MSIVKFPETLSQRILVEIILVGRLVALCDTWGLCAVVQPEEQ